MAQNIFEEYQQKKARIKQLAKKGVEFGWITPSDEKRICEKLDNSTLTIGVIGQMKAGKSTFLNSFIFQDVVLPAATTPMTASLSVITYGPEKKIEAEFYSQDEWAEQQVNSKKDLDSITDEIEKSKVESAKELVEKAKKLGSSLQNYLGKKQPDSFENLKEYVGAEGKYVSITKSVVIYYPDEMLKGVEIVDTPGFSDPIVSREERTKEFLKRADAVIVLLYAGQPLNATDRDILFKNVRQCGIGKVLIGINKYDIPFCNGEPENEIVDYVKDELKKACNETNDNDFVDIIKSVEPIALSAEMSLLSQLSMQTINASDAYSHAYNRYCGKFDISSQSALRKISHIDQFISLVKETIEKEKGEILFKKPVMQIINSGKSKLDEIERQRTSCSNEIKTLSIPDTDLEEKKADVEKAERRINKKIDGLAEDIYSLIKDLIKKGETDYEDEIDATKRVIDSIIDGLGRFSSDDSIRRPLEREWERLVTRKVPRITETLRADLVRKTKSCVDDFFVDVSEQCERYLEDFDYKDTVKSVKNKIDADIESGTAFFDDGSSSSEEGEDNGSFWEDFLIGINVINPAFWVTLGLGHIFSLNDRKQRFYDLFDSLIGDIDYIQPLKNLLKCKDIIINQVQSALIDQLVSPIDKMLEEIIQNSANKEQQLAQKREMLTKLEAEKTRIKEQIAEAEGLK